MTRDEYAAMKNERDLLKEAVITILDVGVEPDHFRPTVEKLLTLTRVLDRAAAEYAAHKGDNVMSFLPDGREIDYQNGDDE
jgi:AcrR family transcriptional regulator